MANSLSNKLRLLKIHSGRFSISQVDHSWIRSGSATSTSFYRIKLELNMFKPQNLKKQDSKRGILTEAERVDDEPSRFS